MKKFVSSLALAGLLFVPKSSAVTLDDLQFWTGSGTNRAALVVAWSAPEAFGFSTVPAPVTNQTLVWGYRFNGSRTGAQMLAAIVAADARLNVIADLTYGTYVVGLDFNFAGNRSAGLTDGSTTNVFTRGFLTNATVNADAAAPVNSTELYWGGYYGPNWEVWNEAGGTGGFLSAPDRGANPYWTPATNNPYAGVHGQWELAQAGLDGINLTNGSWIGFSVAAGGYDSASNAPYNAHKHAPATPDAHLTLTVSPVQNLSGNFFGGQWQAQFLSRSFWSYSLERSLDLQSWSVVTNGISGNGTNLMLWDANSPVDKGFYRIRADRP